jgi:glycine/D-amino acid oxidase-like deaminating enzyme
MGGYENNPILLDKVPADFQFGLYDLDYSVFDTHIDGAVKLCPTFGQAGIKSTICGPESFTPDHKPLMVSAKDERESVERERARMREKLKDPHTHTSYSRVNERGRMRE